MLIPYGTDTPIYYWPIATAVLIAVNVLVFPFQMLMPDKTVDEMRVNVQVDGDGKIDPNDLLAIAQQHGLDTGGPGWIDWALSHGDGLHPHQWITSFFIHGGILHLIGNMIFLWAFGVVVEGKIGPWLFSMLYVGIGVVQNILEQLIYLPFPAPPSLGASSAIYGIMMVALLWAPQDNLKCLMGIWYYFWLVEVPIAMFALVYFFWDFSMAMLSGFSMGTALLHVMGAAAGIVPGVVFLLMYWVDGEQRDLISMLREVVGGQPLKKPKSRKEKRQEEFDKEQSKADRRNMIDRSWDSMEKHLHVGNVKAATELFRQMRKLDNRVDWKEPMLLPIIAQYQQENDWPKVIEYSEVYLKRFHSKADEIRLNLARLYVVHQACPRKAIKTVQQLDAGRLSERQIQLVKQIVRKAQEMIAEGVVELGED